ncbi:6023_t:CDS:2, partial [Acaulospora morrowiae]
MKVQQEPMTLPSNNAWKTIKEHINDKMITKQEEVDEDLEETIIGHPRKEYHQEKATNRPKDVLTNDKVEESLDEKICSELQREVDHVEKVDKAVQEIDAIIRNQELICNEISVAYDSPNLCEKMTITDNRAIVPKVISGQIEVGNEPEKGN